MIIPGTLGYAIWHRRYCQEMGLRELAEDAGVSRTYLSEVERGLCFPSARWVGKVASALGCTVEDLLSDTSRQQSALVPGQRPGI